MSQLFLYSGSFHLGFAPRPPSLARSFAPPQPSPAELHRSSSRGRSWRAHGPRSNSGGGGRAAASAANAAPATLAVPADFRVLSPCGSWRVRPVTREDMEELRRVVAIQAQAFYEGAPLPALDGMFRTFFMAEVLSEMQKKVKFNPAERFVLLVAERADGGGSGSGGDIVGAVEVSYLAEGEVLRSLGPGARAFAYIASMAVDESWRRQGVATALLRAAEEVAGVWEEQQPVLHVYQDNRPAVLLYQDNGYDIIFQDAAWWARLGARPRFLMRKQQQADAAAAAGAGGAAT